MRKQKKLNYSPKKWSCKFHTIIAFFLAMVLSLEASAGTIVSGNSLETTMDENLSNTLCTDDLYNGSVDLQNLSDEQIIGELHELREESTKYFRLTDGTTLAAVYNAPVHKLDTDGSWVEIDNRLSDNGEEYENASGPMRVKFSKNPKNGKLYTLKTDEGQIKWSLSGVKKTAKEGKLSKVSGESEKLSVNSTSERVTYENILPGVTLQYWVSANKLKENIIFSDRESAKPLQFDLQTNQFTASLENNTILFKNKDGETVYALSAPWMMDDRGLTSSDIMLDLSGSKNHYTVTLTPDAEWLENATYPVTVDPLLINTLSGSGIINSIYVTSNAPNSSAYYNYGTVAVGREGSQYGNSRAAFKFDLPTAVTSSDRVISASLQLTTSVFDPANNTTSITINAHKITSNVSISSLTWNTLNGKYSTTVSDSQVLSYAHKTSRARIPFDITTMVRDWYQNGNNYGLALVSENENSTYKYVRLFTDNYSQTSTAYSPVLVIQFANNNGIEDTLTYHTAGNAEMGTVSVNDFNGNLVYSFEDAATPGNLFPASVSHIFDNSYRTSERYSHSGAAVGTGFRLNLYERILDCTIPNYPYKYLDSDGTWHYFKVKNASSKLYVDEFYPSRVLKRLTNSDGTTSGFCLTNGSDIETYFTWNGYLNYKKNTTNNKIIDFYYEPESAVLRHISDGTGQKITFSYTTINGKKYLSSMTDPAGRATTFTYSGTMLSSITRPGNRKISFTYDSNNSLTKIKSYDNSAIAISYYTSTYNNTHSLRRVKSLTEIGTSGTEGQKLTFTYATGETTVTDRNGKSETMMFDDFGQTVCVRDNAGHASFLKYNSPDMMKNVNPNKTDNSEQSISRATQLQYTTKLQSTVNNFVSNPDFEDSTYSPWQLESSTQTGSGGALLSSEQTYLGSKALKISSSSINKRYGYQQPLSLPSLSAGKTYTISAYVKIANLTTSSSAALSGAIVYFGYQYANGTWDIKCSDALQTVGEWVRISRTFTLPANIVSMYAKIGLYGCTGTAYFDNVQVEEGSVVNSYNFIDNGNIDDTTGTKVPSGFKGYNLNSSTDKVVTENGYNCFKIVGERQKYKNIEQTVAVSGKKGDTFTFNAWAKSTGALSRLGSLTSEDRNFEVRIAFDRADGTQDLHYYFFENKSTGWQFLAGEAIAGSDYVAVRMAIIYNNQKNAAFMKDFCLFKEGSNTQYTYDDWGRVKTAREIDKTTANQTTYTYEVPYTTDSSVIPDSRIKSITYPDGTTEKYTYDSAKRIKTYQDSSGALTTYTYDSNGNPVSQKSTTTANSTYLVSDVVGYSSDGNYATSVTDPFGNKTTMTVNTARGLLEAATDAKGTATQYTYDSNTDAIQSVKAGNSTVNYSYTNHKLSSIQHNTSGTANVKYNFTYDAFGNTDTVSVGNRTLIDHTYAANNGKLTRSTYGNGFYTENICDSLDRVTGIKYNGVEKYSWEYGNKGQVGLHKDLVNNQEFRYVYDSLGRVINAVSKPTVAGFSKTEFTNTYNAKNQLTKVIRKIASSSLQTQYSYTGSGWLLKETYNNGSSLNYTYNAFRYPVTKKLTSSSGATILNQSIVYRTGDTSDSKTSQIAGETISGNGWSSNYGYSYDANNNITGITKNGAAFATYGYDTLNQLKTATVGSDTYAYTYDNGGNILSKTKNGVTTAYSYGNSDWKDLLTSYGGQSITYDTIGNPLSYRNGMTFTWQGRRLNTASANGKALSFAYNADGIRSQKTVNGVTTYYTLDGTQIIRQKTGNTTVFFEYDANGTPTTILHAGTTYYYIRNVFGDVIGLADANGNTVVSYTYDPWGKLLSISDSTSTGVGSVNPFRYRGYYYDSETGFYLTGTRYYDPEIGRFINADSVISGTGESVQGYNLFAYCFNNPVNMSDPSGNWPKWATKLVAAVAVVAVVAAVAAVTVATAGAGTAIAAVAVGAAKGAAIGFAVGAASGAAIGYATTGTLEGTLNGMADGALSGSISGAITGGVNGYSNYSSAANFLKSNGANPKEVLSSYKGTPKVQTLKTDTTVYRTWGGTTQELGHWVSPNNYGSSARNLLSLPAGNTMTHTSSFLLPKGTTVLAGKAAPLFGQSGGGVQWWISVLG